MTADQVRARINSKLFKTDGESRGSLEALLNWIRDYLDVSKTAVSLVEHGALRVLAGSRFDTLDHPGSYLSVPVQTPDGIRLGRLSVESADRMQLFPEDTAILDLLAARIGKLAQDIADRGSTTQKLFYAPGILSKELVIEIADLVLAYGTHPGSTSAIAFLDVRPNTESWFEEIPRQLPRTVIGILDFPTIAVLGSEKGVDLVLQSCRETGIADHSRKHLTGDFKHALRLEKLKVA